MNINGLSNSKQSSEATTGTSRSLNVPSAEIAIGGSSLILTAGISAVALRILNAKRIRDSAMKVCALAQTDLADALARSQGVLQYSPSKDDGKNIRLKVARTSTGQSQEVDRKISGQTESYDTILVQLEQEIKDAYRIRNKKYPNVKALQAIARRIAIAAEHTRELVAEIDQEIANYTALKESITLFVQDFPEMMNAIEAEIEARQSEGWNISEYKNFRIEYDGILERIYELVAQGHVSEPSTLVNEAKTMAAQLLRDIETIEIRQRALVRAVDDRRTEHMRIDDVRTKAEIAYAELVDNYNIECVRDIVPYFTLISRKLEEARTHDQTSTRQIYGQDTDPVAVTNDCVSTIPVKTDVSVVRAEVADRAFANAICEIDVAAAKIHERSEFVARLTSELPEKINLLADDIAQTYTWAHGVQRGDVKDETLRKIDVLSQSGRQLILAIGRDKPLLMQLSRHVERLSDKHEELLLLAQSEVREISDTRDENRRRIRMINQKLVELDRLVAHQYVDDETEFEAGKISVPDYSEFASREDQFSLRQTLAALTTTIERIESDANEQIRTTRQMRQQDHLQPDQSNTTSTPSYTRSYGASGSGRLRGSKKETYVMGRSID